MQRRFITYDTALASSTTPDDFALYFRGVGKSDVQQQAPVATSQQPAPATSAAPAEKTLELDRSGRR